MARKTTRSQKEIDAAVKRYLDGENATKVAKTYKVSRAGLYLWIKKRQEAAVEAAHEKDLGPRGVEQETRINKDLRLKQLEEENRKLKARLFQLMNKYGEWG
jgi:transposase